MIYFNCNILISLIDILFDKPYKVLIIVATAFAAGSIGFTAAPVIGAGISTVALCVEYGAMRGAAASAAGLAVLGGGSLAEGGGGIGTGIAIITAFAAIFGGLVSSVFITKFTK